MSLRRLDTHSIPDQPEVRAFMCVKNEMLRLPAMLAHHRRLGVNRFFIVDNGSTDGTADYLAPMTDCHVFHTDEPYQHGGIGWHNQQLATYGIGHWTLLLDADELFVYPHAAPGSLPALCHWLDEQGFEGMFATMVDMYANQPLMKIAYQAGQPLEQACPYFDRDYRPMPRPTFPYRDMLGGPRLRVLYPHLARRGVVFTWLHAYLVKLLRMLHLPIPPLLERAPLNFKIPLVKWQAGRSYLNNHVSTPLKLAPVTGALLHFKYLQDFTAKVQRVVQGGGYYDGGAEYKRFAACLAQQPDLSFMTATSQRYEGPASLLATGLMASAPAWDKAQPA